MAEIVKCRRCSFEASSPRGLTTHWTRTHSISDADIVDFINLTNVQQESVLCHMEDDENGHGDLAYAKGRYREARAIADRMNVIYTQPMGGAERTRFKRALALVTQKDYRYVIDEEP